MTPDIPATTPGASSEGERPGEAMMDGPNTHKMDAPSDVTSWTAIPTIRDVVTADGRGFETRVEWWHVPTFVVEEIERSARLRVAPPSEPGEIDVRPSVLAIGRRGLTTLARSVHRPPRRGDGRLNASPPRTPVSEALMSDSLRRALDGLPPTPWRFTWSSDSQAGGPGNRTWMLVGADDRFIATFVTMPPGADCPVLIRQLGESLEALGNAAALASPADPPRDTGGELDIKAALAVHRAVREVLRTADADDRLIGARFVGIMLGIDLAQRHQQEAVRLREAMAVMQDESPAIPRGRHDMDDELEAIALAARLAADQEAT